MNTNEQTMAWIMDTYSMHMRHTVDRRGHRQAARPGRHRAGRREATGRGMHDRHASQALKQLRPAAASRTRVVDPGLRQRRAASPPA